MSFLFGKKKPKAPAETPMSRSEATNQQIADLKKRNDYQQKKVDQMRNEIKQLAKSGNKKRAVEVLKRMKMAENSIQRNEQIISNLENQVDMIQAAQTNADILKQMKMNKEVMQQSYEGMDLDQVEDLIDEIQEVQQQQNEITDALARDLNPVDEDELEDDLAAIIGEGEDEIEDAPVPAQKTTAAPAAPAAAQDDDEDELASMMASYA